MKYSLEPIAATLKAAREAKGLSQRALSELAGVPQSHISKIEKGSVDLRVSSLIELARILDLELVLVPRKSVPAVSSIVRSTAAAVHPADPFSRAVLIELHRLQRKIGALRQTDPASVELAQLQRQVRDLQHLKFSPAHLEALREVTRRLRAIRGNPSPEDLRRVLSRVQQLRDRMAHDLESASPVEEIRPAYSLEEDEYGE